MAAQSCCDQTMVCFKKAILSLVTVLPLFGCGKDSVSSGLAITHDFSTPEGAILCLEDAYRAKDMKAAIGCKEFREEARLMLEKLGKMPKEEIDKLIDKTAEVLELAYRKEMEQKGFPDMQGVSSSFSTKKPYPQHENIVVVTEICHYPDGGTSQQDLLVAKTANGWRVLNPVD